MHNEIIQTQTTTCGRYILSKDYDLKPQIHCHYKLYYIIDGLLEYQDNDTKKLLKPGNVYVLPDRRMYSVITPESRADKTTELLTFFIISQPNLCDTIVEFQVSKHEILKNVMPFIISIADDCGIGKGANEYSKIMQNSVNMFFNLLHIIKPFTLEYDKKTVNVINYINENLNSSLTNEELAKIAMMSKSNFIKHFTQQIKKTPQKYILDIRMTKALKLLNENHKIEEICELIGYDYVSSFNRAFKKLFSRTPKECVLNLYKRWE
ncbi:MAG: helix-turn-helix domain-containing protein [Saccharofermentanales bacterium]